MGYHNDGCKNVENARKLKQIIYTLYFTIKSNEINDFTSMIPAPIPFNNFGKSFSNVKYLNIVSWLGRLVGTNHSRAIERL